MRCEHSGRGGDRVDAVGAGAQEPPHRARAKPPPHPHPFVPPTKTPWLIASSVNRNNSPAYRKHITGIVHSYDHDC
ncbi:unnamed protein product [Pieris brassicae]|uniref:Uncharacterized protein n=1 Tax=Pieris brassicae TaxID=7116 RepID=A0A9P0TYR2_PIEBR|nr:unnamed protein product [Pieris brassicae]